MSESRQMGDRIDKVIYRGSKSVPLELGNAIVRHAIDRQIRAQAIENCDKVSELVTFIATIHCSLR